MGLRSPTTRALSGHLARYATLVAVLGLILLPAPAASAAPTAAELASQLSALNAEVEEAGKAYDAAYWRLDETEVRLENLEASLVQTEEELSHAEQVMSTRATAIYRDGELSFLEFVFGAGSFEEMISRLALMERIQDAEAEIIIEVRDLKTALTAERDAVDRERERQQKDVDYLRAQKDAVEARLASKQAEYDRLKAELAAAMAREKASGSVTYRAPRGPNGMVFPVAGPNYYSNTWGASRSGGRRSHKGTDIMASRGVPVVATLSGSVRARNGGLGGKSIWLTADNGWEFYYAHLNGFAVTSGRVSAGQVIGYVGSTGNASYSAPHLHYQIHPGGGSAVNPYPYLRQMQ
jgi:murein DD-endopeptidase MepM/ murein hydrolase activator NlpD